MNLAPRDLRDFIKNGSNLMWVFTGDSITHGALHTFGYRDYPELIEERVRWELGRFQDLFVNTGISGDSTRGLLQGFDHRLKRFNPDVVSIMIGMNDCVQGTEISIDEFEDNLIALTRRLRTETPARVILNTQNSVDVRIVSERSHYFAFMEAVREVGARENVPVCDHLQRWEQMRESNPGLFYMLMSDAIHPNQYGHRYFADNLLEWLGLGPVAGLEPVVP